MRVVVVVGGRGGGGAGRGRNDFKIIDTTRYPKVELFLLWYPTNKLKIHTVLVSCEAL